MAGVIMDLEREHVMLDLETMGLKPGCAVVSVGAVRFRMNGDILDTFFRAVDLVSCERAGLTIEAGTVVWWLEQTQEAKRYLLLDAAPLGEVMTKFCAWMGDSGAPVWSYGADFDQPILAAAMAAAGLKAPWGYRDSRCFRTFLAEFDWPGSVPLPTGIAHHSLDDAMWQVKYLQSIVKGMMDS